MSSGQAAFSRRHLGPSKTDSAEMLRAIGCESMDDLIDQVVPENIRVRTPLDLPAPLTEEQALRRLRQLMQRNKVLRSFLGQGYHDTFTPPVIQRNILGLPPANGCEALFFHWNSARFNSSAVLNFDLGYTGGDSYAGAEYLGGASFGNSAVINYFATNDVDLMVDWNFDYSGQNPFGLQIIRLEGGPSLSLGNYGIAGHHEGSTSYGLLAGNSYAISLRFQPNVSNSGGGLSGIDGTLSGMFDFKFGKTDVPESSGIALIAIGLLGLGLARRRKTV